MEKLKQIRYFKYLLISLMIVLIVYYLFKLLLDNPVFKLPDNSSADKNTADSYVKHAQILSYKNGLPKYDFTSQYILHYPADKDSTALQVKLKVFPDRDKSSTSMNKHPWLAKADYAWLSADTSRIRMEKNVVIIQKDEQLQSFTRLETPILWIWPNTEFAKTSQAVKITTDQALITAKGMNADFQTSQYNFLKNVKVTLKL